MRVIIHKSSNGAWHNEKENGMKMKLKYKDREWISDYTFEVRWDNDCQRMHDKEYKSFDSARKVAEKNIAPRCDEQGDLGRSYIVVLDETHTPVEQIWD